MPRFLKVVVFLCCAALGDAHAEDTYAWLMPTPEEQLAADSTEIPIGKGAIFVPSITGPEYEPPATVVTEKEVLSISLGQRVLVDPGPYVVVISSGTPAQGVSIAIDVKEGETTLVPVTWGAVRIEVTDEHRIPHRGSYDIIRADTREPVGTGFGADTLQGEILQTWLLPAGLYRIVKPGRDYRALRDFESVYVPPSGFVRYRLVMDEETGDFYGAGVLLPDEFASAGPEHDNWFKSLVIGVEGAMVDDQNVVGSANQTLLSASGYVDAQVAYQKNDHNLSFLVQAEEGGSQKRLKDDNLALPVEKSVDRLRGDALYTYDIKGSTGPYVRASAESQAFATNLIAEEDTTFVTTLPNGDTRTNDVAANETFRLSEPWAPTLLREGAGINTSFVQKARSMNFNFRIGYGMRQNLYRDALVLDDIAATSATEYSTVESFYEEGIESTVVATLRLPGWIVYSTDLELFADFQSLDKPSASWRNTLSLRITRNVSLNYYLNLDYEPQVIDKGQWEQSLLFRASWSIF